MAVAGLGVFALSAGGSVTLTGLGLILMGALCWALGNLVLRRMGPVNTLALFVWASLVPPVPMLALSMVIESPTPFATLAAMTAQGWLAVFYVAIASTVLGYSLWGALLARHPASAVTPFALLIPVVGLSVAWVMLGERPAIADWIGAAIIVGSISYIAHREAVARRGRART